MKKTLFSLILGCLFILTRGQTPPPGSPGLWDDNHFLWFTGHWSKSGNRPVFVIDKGNGSSGNPVPGAPASASPPSGTPPAGTDPQGTSPGGPPNTGTPPSDPPDPETPPGNPPAGGSITVNPDGTMSLGNSNVDDWNKRMDKALDGEQKYLKGLQDPGPNLDPTTYHLHQLLIPGAQQRVDDIKSYRIDPSSDMLGNDKPAKPGPGRTVADGVGEDCQAMKADYNEVMNWYTSQVKNHRNNLPYPKPPEIDYDCYACDSSLRTQYDTTLRNYARDFAKEEIDILNKGYKILGAMGTVNIDERTVSYPPDLSDLFKKSKDPSKAGPCAYLDVWDLSTACHDIAYHIYRRAEKMLYDNRSNYKTGRAVLLAYIRIAGEWNKVGGQKEDASAWKVAQDLAEKIVRHYLDELRKNDWRQIANFPLLLSLARDRELMGSEDGKESDDLYKEVVHIINGFKLSVDMDIKIGVNDGYKLAHLKGQCHIIPSFQQNQNQCYKWVVADLNRKEPGVDGEGIYMARDLQTIDVNLLATEIVAPGRTPKYSGTKKYTTRLVSLSMDFCHPGNDTIDLTGFTANPPDAGTWLWPNGAVTTEGEIGMEQYFENTNDKKRFANDGEAKKAKDDLKTQAEKLRVQMEALKAQMTSGQAAGPPGANMEKMMELKQQALSKVAEPAMAKMLFINFLLPVQNNSTALVDDKKFNAREINPQEAKAIVYGYYTIRIENTVNGGSSQTPGLSASPSSSASPQK
jgi:hypothetical protein